MDKFNFEVLHKDSKSNARCGIIHTAHGDIKTPSFVAVGTQATVKAMTNRDLLEIGNQVFFVNTYHIFLRPGMETIEKAGGLHKFMNWNKPLMTDSAGFQIFSLAKENKRGIKISGEETQVPLVKINDDGVEFRSHINGDLFFFDAKKSMEVQSILGADIMIAFDECTYYPSTHEYAEKAMKRTHGWGKICLDQRSKIKAQRSRLNLPFQALYGVVQGGTYEDLRKESAKFINDLAFDGYAIGGVSVGESKKEMIDVLDWTIPYLNENKPRHLLGVGEVDDIFNLVERGIDTFDCVMPTRLARMGFVLINNSKEKFELDLNKSFFENDFSPIEEGCNCYACKNHTKSYLHHLFKAKEILACQLATIHNLFFMETLVGKIRDSINRDSFLELKKETFS